MGDCQLVAALLANEYRGAIGRYTVVGIVVENHALRTLDDLCARYIIACKTLGESDAEGQVDGGVGITSDGNAILLGRFDVPERCGFLGCPGPTTYVGAGEVEAYVATGFVGAHDRALTAIAGGHGPDTCSSFILGHNGLGLIRTERAEVVLVVAVVEIILALIGCGRK